MAISDDRCLKIITEASQGKISRDEAENILEKVQGRIDANLKKGMGEPSAIDKAVKDSLTEGAIERTRARLRSIQDAQKSTLMDNRATRATNEIVNIRGGKEGEVKASDMFDAVRSILHGINRSIKGGRQSLESSINDTFKNLLGSYGRDLGNSGLLKFAQKGTYDEEVYREMSELNKSKGEEGLTKNPYAQQLAKIFNNYVSLAKNTMNDAGANIKDLFGYVIRNEHNWEKIKDAGQAGWKEDVLKWADHGKSFGGLDKIQLNQYLNGLHSAFVSGEHLGPIGGGEGMNVAKMAGEQRYLHFTDDGAYQYWKKYGTSDTLMQAVQTSLERSSKNASLMKMFGTNPELGYQKLIGNLKQNFSQVAPEAVREFKEKYEAPLQNRWNELNGTMDMPKNRILKNIGVGTRVFENIVHLGNVLFAHASIPVTRAANMRHWGDSMLTSYADSLGDFFTKGGTYSADQKAMLETLGAMNDGMISNHLGMYGNGFTGAASTINNTYMKLTGLPYAIQSQKIGVERSLSRLIGGNLDKEFEGLKPDMQSSFKTYGIGKEEWDMLRKVAPTHADHMTPDMGERIDDTTVKSILEREKIITDKTSAGGIADAVEKYKRDLTNNLSAMYSDTSRRALNLPGAETRAILYRGTKSGSVPGEIMRALTMFKQWPTELIINTMGREIYDNKTTGGKMLGLFHLASALTCAGYIRMALRDTTSGYAPPPPTNMKTILEAAQEGGAGMVFGDMLMGMAKQTGFAYTPGEKVLRAGLSLLGPAAGSFESLTESVAKGVQQKNIGKQLADFAIKNIPGQNLFYIKLLTNYAFLWSLHDMIHPGWSQRYENSIQRETGNKPFVGPVKK